MNNFPDAHKVYELAAVFRERVIEQGRSFFWPNQEIWTPENTEDVLYWLSDAVSQGALTKDNWIQESLARSPITTMILADVICSRDFFKGVSSERRIQERIAPLIGAEGLPEIDPETVARFYEVARIYLPESHATWSGHIVEAAIGHLNTLRGLILGKVRSDASSSQIWEAINAAAVPEIEHGQWWATDLLSLMYPDAIPFATPTDTAKITRHYQNLISDTDPDDRLDALRQIRRALHGNGDVRDFSFYSPEYMSEWEKDETRKKNFRRWQGFPVDPDMAPAALARSKSNRTFETGPYAIARLFRDRVILNDESLLWPGEPVWTTDVIEDFLTRFQQMPVNMGETWLEVYENEFGAHADDVTKLLADSYSLLMQFPSVDTVEGSIKERTLQAVLARITDASPDPVVLAKVTEGFHVGVGDPGTDFLDAVQIQVAYVPALVQAHRADPELGLEVAADKAQRIIAATFGVSQTVDPVRNIILHLFEPGSYEPIASQDHKETIVEKFQDQLGLEFDDEATDTDRKIRSIRRALEHGYFDPGFDFYDEAVKPYWLGNNRLDGEGGTALSGPTITDLAAETYLDPGFLGQIERLLAEKKQLIFEGPPGSGKTFVAEKFARYFTGQPLSGADRNEQIELVQFHQSYSYEDFVEGIRPRTNEDGQLVYDIEKGIFRRFAETAEANPDKRFVLIIDEVNRGNLSRILGELMLLLEYRNQSSTLPYSKDKLQIPENLYIIGTMNSADRSLSQIDYALRRRFFFVRFMSVEQERAPVLEGWLKPRTSEWERVVSLFIALNAQLRSHMATDDLQVGHSYFMRHDIHKRSVQDEVWQYAVMPLLREYLYHHRDRDTMLQQYQIDSLMQQSVPAESLIAETDPDDV